MLESSLSKDQYHINNLFNHLFSLSKHCQFTNNNNKNVDDIDDKSFNDNNNLSIGITGAPGAGKSTFIEQFGTLLLNNSNNNNNQKNKNKNNDAINNAINDIGKEHQGNRLAVLTVDPSSSISGGSILGDKVRMPLLSRNPRAFIRSSPLGNGHFGSGGVGCTTFDAIRLCHAAGYQTVIVESVGIGQSEVFIGNLVDCLLYLQVPGGGDELQAMKKGIIELADLIIVNKADLADSMNTIFQLKSALGLSSFTTASINKSFNEMKFTSNPKYKNKEKDDGNEAMKKGNEFESKYQKVLAVSAKTGQGMNQVLNEIDSFVSHQKSSGLFSQRRKNRQEYWIRQGVKEQVLKDLVRFNFDSKKSESLDSFPSKSTFSSKAMDMMTSETIWFESQKLLKAFYESKQNLK